jgi:hypothetical protein
MVCAVREQTLAGHATNSSEIAVPLLDTTGQTISTTLCAGTTTTPAVAILTLN